MKKILSFFIALLCLSIVSFVVVKKESVEVAASEEVKNIRVGLKWLKNAQFAGIFTALDKGFYHERSVKVEIVERSMTAPRVIDQILSGQLEVGVVSMSEFLVAASAGGDIVALAAIFQYSPTNIISLKEANIHSPADLVGKRVGVSDETPQSKLVWRALFAQAGITDPRVTYVPVGYDQLGSLLRREVDAVSVYRTDMFTLKKENIPYNAILPERYGVDLYNDIIVTSKSFLREEPGAVASFINATLQGWNYAFENPEESLSIVLKYDDQKYHDREIEEFILSTARPLIQPSYRSIGTMNPTQWAYAYTLFKNNGLISPFNIYHHLSFSPYR